MRDAYGPVLSVWRAGAATTDFPVAPGTPMDGYLARTGGATGTHDMLAIGALILQRGSEQLAFVTADVLGMDTSLVDAVAAAAGLERDRLLLCASHTHAGPAGLVARLHPASPPSADPAIQAAFRAACVEAIAWAQGCLEPVTLRVGQCQVPGIAANRNDPAGPYVDTVTTLSTVRGDGALQAVLVHFACHPTVLSADNRLISAEFPGALREALARRLAPDAPVVLYANGAAGDVSTRFTRQSQGFDEVERVGEMLADATAATLTHALPLDGPLRLARTNVTLPPKRIARGYAEREAALAAAEAVRLKQEGALHAAQRQALTRAQGAALQAQVAGMDMAPSFAPLTVAALGDLALVSIPGELFSSLGQRIEATSPSPTTMILGYTNGYVGYLPDRAAYEARTYEALASPFAPGAGEAVVRALAVLLNATTAASTGDPACGS